MSSRFFDDQDFTLGDTLVLGDSASHHISKVLRMQPGDTLTLFNGRGGEWQATLVEVRKKTVTATILGFDPVSRTAPFPVTLLLPLLKPDRMDYALQKSVELGVSQIQLVITARTEGRVTAERLEKRMEHFRQVIISACEQCGLNLLPSLQPPQKLSDALQAVQSDLRLVAHPGEQPLALAQIQQAGSVALLTGPEGGLSDEEVALAMQAGFTPFALGERVLRAETAPPALLAALWGIREFSA